MPSTKSRRARIEQLRAVRREGGYRKATLALVNRVVERVYDSGKVIWLAMDVDPSVQPQWAFDKGVRRATEADLPELERLRPLTPHVQQVREGAGGERWLVPLGDEIGFTCWVFRKAAVVAAYPPITIPLPSTVAHVEDSYATREGRGKNLHIIAFAEIIKVLHSQGVEHLITKIDVENTVARKAAQKGGWYEFAHVTGTQFFSGKTHWKIDRVIDKPIFPDLDTLTKKN